MEEKDIKKYIDNFASIDCPICNKFYFSKPKSENEIKDYEDGLVQCSECGWIYDKEQLLDENLKYKHNVMSINEYKKWYNEQLSADSNFNYWEKYIKEDPTSHICPVCGEYKFKDELSFDICKICGWEDDGCDRPFDGEEMISANHITFSEYKKQFLEKRKKDPNYRWDKEHNL